MLLCKADPQDLANKVIIISCKVSVPARDINNNCKCPNGWIENGVEA